MQVSTEEQLAEAEAAVEAFETSVAPRVVAFQWPDAGGNPQEWRFTQAKLGFFPAQELGTIITRLAKGVMDGKYGVDVMQLIKDRQKLQTASLPDQLSTDAVEEAFKQWKPYIEAFLRIMDEVPELQQDVIALSLGVRRKDRAMFKEMISEAPHAGGLDVDEGVEIIKVFVRQNVGVIRRFLGEQIREIAEVVMEAIGEGSPRAEDDGSNGSTPSSTSGPHTPE